MLRKEKIIGGLSWSVLSKLSRQLLQLAIIFVLSRILSPAEFGLMSMVTAFSMLAEIVRNMGMGAAVIREKNEDRELLDTAFTFNLIVGIIVFLLFFACAPLIAKFYKQHVLIELIRVFSVVYIIGAFNIVQEALLQKKMEFKRLFFMDVSSVVISGIIAITLAMRGFGVWSLVWQYISMITISSFVLWITSSWKPSVKFHISTFRNFRKYSFSLFLHDLIYFVGRDADKFLVGKFAGPSALGVYYRAFLLMLLPVNQVNIVIAKVMFPALSSLQDNLAEMKKVYLRATNMISYISFPSLALMFIIAEPLIILLLGREWVGTAVYLRIFCIYGMLESVGTTVYWIYKSVGRTGTMLKWGIISTICTVLSVITGLYLGGAKGVAISYVCVQLLLWIPGWKLAFKLVDLDFVTMLKNISPNFLTAVAGLLPAWLIYTQVSTFHPLNVVSIVSISYIIAYLLFSAITKQPAYLFLHKMARNYWSIKFRKFS